MKKKVAVQALKSFSYRSQNRSKGEIFDMDQGHVNIFTILKKIKVCPTKAVIKKPATPPKEEPPKEPKKRGRPPKNSYSTKVTKPSRTTNMEPGKSESIRNS